MENVLRGGRPYLLAWASLVALTAGSFLFTHLGLGNLGLLIALSIAAVKASIVMIVFMHLDREPFPARFIAFINVLWVILICAGIFADVGVQ